LTINQKQIKSGDFILGFAKDRISHHYMLAFAARIDAATTNSVSMLFNGYYYDDGTLTLDEEDKILSKAEFQDLLCESIVGIFSEETYNEFLALLVSKELDEDNMFIIFDDYWDEALVKINDLT
jgi:hypothetical protein